MTYDTLAARLWKALIGIERVRCRSCRFRARNSESLIALLIGAEHDVLGIVILKQRVSVECEECVLGWPPVSLLRIADKTQMLHAKRASRTSSAETSMPCTAAACVANGSDE